MRELFNSVRLSSRRTAVQIDGSDPESVQGANGPAKIAARRYRGVRGFRACALLRFVTSRTLADAPAAIPTPCE